ncbi:hypothetical protein [Emticicia sp. BO119]|uniref:hypothetical protein n=1 Tax=Emticicia sp. BO119 TaxID=2757768 RepID=UPI0015F0510A|nr:hypothetical protein [Emticicia sp. BO119]MBA4849433.1 hypothetical protein [Emticicia sp. BO119]
MKLKPSSSQILSFVVGFFMILLLSLLVYSLKSINNKYNHYKTSLILSDPYEIDAKIIDVFAMGRGFEIEYKFRGKSYSKAIKITDKLYKKYKPGDKLPITISIHNPELVRISSQLQKYKKPNS